MIHFLDQDRPRRLRSPLADLLLSLPAGRRGGVLLAAVSFRPDDSIEQSFRTGPVRAAFADHWEHQFGEAVPSQALRKAIEPPVPFGTAMAFNCLAVAHDMVEAEHCIAKVIGQLRQLLDSLQVGRQ